VETSTRSLLCQLPGSSEQGSIFEEVDLDRLDNLGEAKANPPEHFNELGVRSTTSRHCFGAYEIISEDQPQPTQS
jgi:hypothetical protein